MRGDEGTLVGVPGFPTWGLGATPGCAGKTLSEPNQYLEIALTICRRTDLLKWEAEVPPLPDDRAGSQALTFGPVPTLALLSAKAAVIALSVV